MEVEVALALLDKRMLFMYEVTEAEVLFFYSRPQEVIYAAGISSSDA